MKHKIIYKDLEYFNFKIDIFSDVYDIREDTLLLCKSLLEEKGRNALVLCCGAGLEGLILTRKNFQTTCIDINPIAVENAKHNFEKNKLKGEFLISNLFEKIQGKFDVIVCNPPYVPSDEIKHLDLDGGKNGREIIDKILSKYSEYLKENGRMYLLVSSLNNINKGKIVAKQKLDFEELQVLCFKK